MKLKLRVCAAEAPRRCCTVKVTRSITEPSGALAVAGIKQHVAQSGAQGHTFVAIDSGGNINFDSLRHVAERAAVEIA